MSTGTLYLRRAQLSDMDLLYSWANEEEVRMNAFNTKKIPYEDHINWFNRMMADPNEVQYILVRDGEPIGQIRLSINGDEAEIGYSIAKSVRGCGYGKEVIRLVIKQVKTDFPYVVKLIGKVKPSNVASYYCFSKNGFEETYRQLEYDLSKGENVEFEKLCSGG